MGQIKWITEESEKWVQDGIISPEQQSLILNRYGFAKTGSPILIFFAIIGSLLIGGGIILIFATNWWRMPVPIKLLVAFLPLLAAQALCLHVAKKKYGSAAFREGGAVFLCLAFFAVIALVGQTFHTASDLKTYLLLCGLFALPPAYLFRSKAALSIYSACALYSAWDDWRLAFLLCALSLPLFYLGVRREGHRGAVGYQLTLLSALVSMLIFTIYDALPYSYMSGYDLALSIGAVMLILDALYSKVSTTPFLTPPKLFGCLCISVTIWVAGIDFLESKDYSLTIAVIILCFAYAWLRYSKTHSLKGADIFIASAAILTLCSPFMGVAANLLMLAIGVFFIAAGSRALFISYINIGMAFLVMLIGTRFFDSALSLLARGIVFILLGAAFLAVNLVISRRRRELSK